MLELLIVVALSGWLSTGMATSRPSSSSALIGSAGSKAANLPVATHPLSIAIESVTIASLSIWPASASACHAA